MTANRPKPRYPIYVISKGRHDCCLTADALLEDEVDFRIVVEPQEFELYAQKYDPAIILQLPFSNLNQGSIPARNWVWEHSKAAGHDRHWIFDDNIRGFKRLYKGVRLPVNGNYAIAVVEDFTDRYTNIAIAGMNYDTFVIDSPKPFVLNAHVYSSLLIKNDLPNRWRGRYNEDTDLCLQVLSAGHCTVLFNAMMICKVKTMTMKGGNTDELYAGDGRLRMARSLERKWPYVVETKRRFQRPQHVIKKAWRGFDTQLIRRTDIDWDNLQVDEYGMRLVQKTDEIKSADVAKLLNKHREQN